MAKINLDNVRGLTVHTVLADKDYDNGLFVGLGQTVENEINMFEVDAANTNGAYLITTPEIDRTSKSNSLEHVNKKGSHMRVHQLEKGDIFSVETAIHGATAKKGQLLKVEGTQLVNATADTAIAEVMDLTTIGADARPAIRVRMLKNQG